MDHQRTKMRARRGYVFVHVHMSLTRADVRVQVVWTHGTRPFRRHVYGGSDAFRRNSGVCDSGKSSVTSRQRTRSLNHVCAISRSRG